MDRVDGEVARYGKSTSSRGEHIEKISHHIVDLSMYTGLILGVYRSLGSSLVLLSGLFLILFDALKRYVIYDYRIINKHLENIKLPNIFVYEINMLIFSHVYISYWIIIVATLDMFLPMITIYSFSMNYMMFFILFQLFMRFLKFIVTLIIYLLPKKGIKM